MHIPDSLPRPITLMAILLLAANVAWPATIEVPAEHATLAEAMQAAEPDDTILITDSSTYDVGTFTFDKRINLEAADGQSPIILGVVTVGTNAAGSRIGNAEGGRITFEDNGTTSDHTFTIAASPIPTRFENLLLRRGVASSSALVLRITGTPAPVDLDFERVEINAAVSTNYGFRPSTSIGPGSRIDFTRCKFTGAIYQGMFFSSGNSGDGEYNFHQCDFSGNQRAGFYFQEVSASANVTINLTESFITGGSLDSTPLRVYGGGAAGLGPAAINVEHSVVRSYANSPAVTFQVFGGGTNNNVSLNLRNCDLIALGSNQSALRVMESVSTTLAISLLDCNVIATGSAVGIGNDNPSLANPILATNCNVVAGTPGSPTVQFASPITPPVTPAYLNPASRDYRYPNASLLTASSTAGPVGSYMNFAYDLPELPEIGGRFGTEALANIRANRDSTDWGGVIASQYYGAGALSRYNGLSDEQLRDFIPDLTPFRSVFCPLHPVRRWYNWQFLAPNRVMCLDAPVPHFYLYDPEDTTEDWNVQGTLRYERVQHILGNLVGLAVSYHINENQRHGEQAAVIVRRFAEAWPEWKIKRVNQWTFHEEAYRNAGRLGGWYVADGVALGEVAEAYGLLKNTDLFAEADRVFIEANLFNAAISFFRHPESSLGFGDGTIGNDEPAIYTGIAKMAVATSNDDLADWVIDEVAEIYNPARGMFHADGFWHEGTMNYHMMSATLFLDFPQVMRGYNDFDAFTDPRFDGLVRSLMAPAWFMWADGSSPPTKDGHRSAYSHGKPPPRYSELLYHATGDTEMLAMARHLAGLQGLSRWQSDISLRFPPPPQDDDPPPPGPLPSHLFPDAGYVHFRHGTDISSQMAATLSYSSMVPHGHFDTNGFLLFAHGHEMAMDIGYLYEQYTRGWATTTLGHNTVTLNRAQQLNLQPPRVAELLFNLLNEPIQAAETEGQMVYSAASMYRRLIATMPFDDEEAYVFDIFRVRGGTIHDWRLQSNGGPMTIGGVGEWAPWAGASSYRVTYYNQVLTNSPSPLQEAEIATPSGVWTAEWDVAPADEVSYRVHLIPQPGDSVVRASIPAARDYNQSDINARMPGLMIHRTGSESVFVAVHEPIKGQARIHSVEPLSFVSSCPVAVGIRVELTDGSSHVLLSTSGSDEELTAVIAEGVEVGLKGRFGALRLGAQGHLQSAALGSGTRLWGPGLDVEFPTVETTHVLPASGEKDYLFIR